MRCECWPSPTGRWPVIPDEPSPDDVERQLTFVGLLGMIDPARPEVKVAVEVAKSGGPEEHHDHRRLQRYGRRPSPARSAC